MEPDRLRLAREAAASKQLEEQSRRDREAAELAAAELRLAELKEWWSSRAGGAKSQPDTPVMLWVRAWRLGACYGSDDWAIDRDGDLYFQTWGLKPDWPFWSQLKEKPTWNSWRYTKPKRLSHDDARRRRARFDPQELDWLLDRVAAKAVELGID
jgi:hypothetical protein